MSDASGVVRVAFATVALGMGVNFADLNRIIHYGAPRSLDNYLQECGRAGRSGDQAYSTIYWCPRDAPMYKDLSDQYKQEITLVRQYLENTETCRRVQLLKYFRVKTLLCQRMLEYVVMCVKDMEYSKLIRISLTVCCVTLVVRHIPFIKLIVFFVLSEFFMNPFV